MASPGFSFPKASRLHTLADFDRVRKEGTKIRGELISLGIFRAEDTKGGFRAGFVTSRRIGTAVARNRVRRRLREIVRHHRGELRGDLEIVVIASPRAAQATYAELEAEWLRLAKRASILAA